jgi:hypothetical protein
VSGEWGAGAIDAEDAGFSNRGNDDFSVLPPKKAVFASVRVEAADRDARRAAAHPKQRIVAELDGANDVRPVRRKAAPASHAPVRSSARRTMRPECGSANDGRTKSGLRASVGIGEASLFFKEYRIVFHFGECGIRKERYLGEPSKSHPATRLNGHVSC